MSDWSNHLVYAILPSAAAGVGLGNYTIAYIAGKLTVNPAELTITATSLSKSYGQAVSFAGTEFTENGLIIGDVISSIALSSLGSAATAGVASSPYPIVAASAAGGGLANYTIAYVPGLLTVTRAPLTVAAGAETMTYGGTVPGLDGDYTITGFANGETAKVVSGAPALSTPATGSSPAGAYPIAVDVTGLSAANYSFDGRDGTLEIAQAALAITARSSSKTYGQAAAFAGTEFTAVGLLNQDRVTSVSLTSVGAAATAGVAGSPYPIVPSAATGVGLDNYTIAYIAGKLTVNPSALTIIAQGESKTYGQAAAFAGTEFIAVGLLNQDRVTTVTLSSPGATATAAASASPYPIVPSTATGVGLDNYTISYSAGGLTVNPAALTVTAANTSKAYGQAMTLAGSGFTAVGLVNGDAITSVTMTSVGTSATAWVTGSPYPIVPAAAVGVGLGNYSIKYVAGAMTVTPATLTVSLTGTASKTYDGTKGATLDSTSYLLEGVMNGDMVGLNAPTSGTYSSKDVGSGLMVDVAGLLLTNNAAGNYVLATSGVSGPIGQITPAALTITANNQTKVYGAALPALSVSYAGFVNGDSASSPGFTPPSVVTAATPSSHVNAGGYPIAASGAVDADYAITYVLGVLTITPASLTIAVGSATAIAGQALPALTVSYGGFVNGDTPASLATPPTPSTSATPASPPGSYPITAGGAGSPDYTITYVAGTLTIAQALVTVRTVTTPTVRVGKKKVQVIVLQFSGALNAANGQNVHNYTLRTVAQGKKRPSKAVAIARATYDLATNTVTLTTAKKLVLNPPLQLTLNAQGLPDTLGRPLDGGGSGQPGSSFTATLSKSRVTMARG